MDVFSIAVGAVGVGIAYFLYLASTRGLPAALAWARAKWNAGKADLAGLQGDVDHAHDLINAQQGSIGELRSALAAVQADVDRLKAARPPGFLAAAPAAVPAAQTQAAG